MSFYKRSTWLLSVGLFAIAAVLTIGGCGEREGETSPVGAIAAEAIAPAKPAPPEHLVHPPADPRKALAEALDEGLLAGDLSNNDKLAAILEVAGVPEASQVLVFSKTSLQQRLINPSNPRAIYFNDNCYIGYVPGGLVEYGDADPDPSIGSGMFAIDLSEREHATLERDGTCAVCHNSARTNGKPGFFVRSVFPDPQGHVITSAGSTTVGQHTPLAKRWGGWYVTGQSGGTHHRGNQVTVEHPDGDAYINNQLGSNIEDLSTRFNVSRYLQPTSDIVALMVLEHQMEMHNRLTQGSSSVRTSVDRARSIAESLGEPYDPLENDTLQRVIASNAGKIVRHMLYCSEEPLTEPISGVDAFIDQFRANRREDAKGRSLKDFNLQTRMFEYRCSYMVYSKAFDDMPDLLKQAVLDKLRNVLEGNGDPDVYGHLDVQEREAIRRILIETGVL
jgi:hypothetical protein